MFNCRTMIAWPFTWIFRSGYPVLTRYTLKDIFYLRTFFIRFVNICTKKSLMILILDDISLGSIHPSLWFLYYFYGQKMKPRKLRFKINYLPSLKGEIFSRRLHLFKLNCSKSVLVVDFDRRPGAVVELVWQAAVDDQAGVETPGTNYFKKGSDWHNWTFVVSISFLPNFGKFKKIIWHLI